MDDTLLGSCTRDATRWLAALADPLRGELDSLLGDPGRRDELIDSFRCDLAFGTGGLRGIMGPGPNRMNVMTVAKATQGLADYLLERFEDPSVALCMDSRNNGSVFLRTVACVLAANGVRSYMYPRLEPTPALSYAVRALGCAAGVCVTASHNPAAYNGYKVYGPDGCQITTEAARQIQARIDAVDVLEGWRSTDFERAFDDGLIGYIPDGVLESFIADAVRSCPGEDGEAACDLKIVYTPLNGAGLECVTKALAAAGFGDIIVVPEQASPDGDFPTCPYPNPEIRPALAKGLALCESVHPDLLLATDPDADRVGVAVLHDGAYELLSGNEVGILLLDWLCGKVIERGGDIRDSVVLTTVVSSAMADALADDHGFELRRTLTGFKFLGEQIGLLEAGGDAGRFLLAFEESYGYLGGPYARDKDAVGASVMICRMARDLKTGGADLYSAMQGLYRRYGYYSNLLLSFDYPGAEGSVHMGRIMRGLREDPPASIGGLPVTGMVDYASGVPMPMVNGGATAGRQALPGADMLQFDLGPGTKVMVRPSGTEPKVKAYLFARGEWEEDAAFRLQVMEAAVRSLLS